MPQPTKQLTELEADLKAHFDKLPKDVQQAILSVDYEKVLKDITQRYHLHIDQGAKLETETTLIMLGLVQPKNYSKNLIFEARIDPKAAELIASEVNEKIFQPIIASLHEMLVQQLGNHDTEVGPEEDHVRDLSPVEIGTSLFDLRNEKETSPPQPETPMVPEKKDAALFAQKLTSISGQKTSETVMTEEPDATKQKETPPRTSLYKGNADPYHEPIE